MIKDTFDHELLKRLPNFEKKSSLHGIANRAFYGLPEYKYRQTESLLLSTALLSIVNVNRHMKKNVLIFLIIVFIPLLVLG
ncbi:MAG: hypothetical protein AAGA66_14725, partial [Bacteroidota bacterium]